MLVLHIRLKYGWFFVCVQVMRKLAGAAAGTAAWATTVGNEHGQILTSVLTAAEGTYQCHIVLLTKFSK